MENMMPIYVSAPRAVRRFALQSLPRTAFSTLLVLAGLKKSRSSKKVALTFSISEDYARLWHYFAHKNLPQSEWDIVIVDCAGSMNPQYFEDAEIIKFANRAHGKKIDTFLYKYLKSSIVFLCDDDKYIISDVSPAVHELEKPKIAAVSLSPRDWSTFKVGGVEHSLMGTYSLLMKRDVIVNNSLSFQSVKRDFKNRIVQEGAKKPFGYDTADFANERLIEMGYEIITDKYHDTVLGFDGLSTPRILLMSYGKQYVLNALAQVNHYKRGSLNGVMARVLFGVVQFEILFRHIFKTDPAFSSRLTKQELVNAIEGNSKTSEMEKQDVLSDYSTIEEICRQLITMT